MLNSFDIWTFYRLKKPYTLEMDLREDSTKSPIPHEFTLIITIFTLSPKKPPLNMKPQSFLPYVYFYNMTPPEWLMTSNLTHRSPAV